TGLADARRDRARRALCNFAARGRRCRRNDRAVGAQRRARVLNTRRATMTIAIITGGSRGLGRSMALQLAERGVDVIVTYRNRSDEAQSVVAEIERRGRTA